MSPGLTMERVYAALKRQIMTGERPPGERLDPARMAPEFHSSVTPVRDALHRLVGERIVHGWPQDGFHAPIHTEPGLRDLYRLNLELLLLAVRQAIPVSTGQAVLDDERCHMPDHASAIAELFQSIADSSDNFEHRHVIAGISDRLHLARLAEASLIGDVDAECALLCRRWSQGDRAGLRQLLKHYHARRIRLTPRIAALVRPGR